MAKQMKSEVGDSRKARIAALFAAGLDNDAVLAAMQHIYPQTIENDDLRKSICKNKHLPYLPYDKAEKDRLGWAIRQVKGLMIKENEEIDDVMSIAGAGAVESPDDIPYENITRFQTGIPSFDRVYGETVFVWTEDDAKGHYKKGQLMPTDPGPGNWVVDDEDLAKREKGMPKAFLSLWGGSPGVGKSRLAISLCKSLNRLNKKILYFNGEAGKGKFRNWLGTDIDNDLFRIVSGGMIKTSDAVAAIYQEKPELVVFDSLQMLAEANKGGRGIKTALSCFNVLKEDSEAGRPHIVFISQLNKKDELAGSRYLEHMVDFAALVTPVPGRKHVFMFRCPRKNRGGATPAHALCKHTAQGVETLSSDFMETPVYKYMQTNGEAVQEGIKTPKTPKP